MSVNVGDKRFIVRWKNDHPYLEQVELITEGARNWRRWRLPDGQEFSKQGNEFALTAYDAIINAPCCNGMSRWNERRLLIDLAISHARQEIMEIPVVEPEFMEWF